MLGFGARRPFGSEKRHEPRSLCFWRFVHGFGAVATNKWDADMRRFKRLQQRDSIRCITGKQQNIWMKLGE